jgi:hypothetical protein
MATELSIESEETHFQESDASLGNALAKLDEERIKIEAARAAKLSTSSTSSESDQWDHGADSPLSPVGSRITKHIDAALNSLESELVLEKDLEFETDSTVSLSRGDLSTSTSVRPSDVFGNQADGPGKIRDDSDSLGPGAFRIGTEDEETCYGATVTWEIPVALAWNVRDHDLVVEQAVEQRLQERLQSMSVVNAVEVTNVCDADDDSSTDDIIKARRCLGRLVQKIFSVMRSRSKRSAMRSRSKRKRKQNDAITMAFFGV